MRLGRKKVEEPKAEPYAYKLEISDTDRFEFLSRVSGMTREQVDATLAADAAFVRRKELDAAISIVEGRSYYSYTSDWFERLAWARKRLRELAGAA